MDTLLPLCANPNPVMLITLTLRRVIKPHRVRVKKIFYVDPRGLGTQLYSAASPNQVIKINA